MMKHADMDTKRIALMILFTVLLAAFIIPGVSRLEHPELATITNLNEKGVAKFLGLNPSAFTLQLELFSCSRDKSS